MSKKRKRRLKMDRSKLQRPRRTSSGSPVEYGLAVHRTGNLSLVPKGYQLPLTMQRHITEMPRNTSPHCQENKRILKHDRYAG